LPSRGNAILSHPLDRRCLLAYFSISESPNPHCAAIETAGITPKKSGLQRLPTQPIELTEEQIEDVETLLDKIEDDDVQVANTNLG